MDYEMFAASSPGPKYSKKGWPCQDSAGCNSFGRVKAIAVADGHGSADCFRSQVGARIAVDIAFRQLERYCREEVFDTDGPALFSRAGIENYKYDFLEEWKRAVREHWFHYFETHKSLGEDEIRFRNVSEKYRQRYLSDDSAVVNRYLYTAYGTTLLLAVSIGTQILLLQIGDGTCVALLRDGTFILPVPPDEDNYLNVTVSMCEEDALYKFRFAVLDCDPSSQSAPAAVFLSSDGVDDCFPVYKNEEHLYKLYALVLESILNEGLHATKEDIEKDLLGTLTSRGSQDDISLAFLTAEDKNILREAYERIEPAYRPAIQKYGEEQEKEEEQRGGAKHAGGGNQEDGEEQEDKEEQERGEKQERGKKQEGGQTRKDREERENREEQEDGGREQPSEEEELMDDTHTADKSDSEESVYQTEGGEEETDDHNGQPGAVS